jgi:hypothetical protein
MSIYKYEDKLKERVLHIQMLKERERERERERAFTYGKTEIII